MLGSKAMWFTKEREETIADALQVKQPIGLIGLNEDEIRGLVEYISSLNDIGGAICRCDCNVIAHAKSQEQCFVMFADYVLQSVVGMLDESSVVEAQKLFQMASSAFSGCRNFYKELVNKLEAHGRSIILIFTGYEKLLMMPRSWRDSFTGWLFNICDDKEAYKTTTIFCSQVPLMWCEYHVSALNSSVIYQRALEQLIREPSKATVDAVVKSLPESERSAFVKKVLP